MFHEIITKKEDFDQDGDEGQPKSNWRLHFFYNFRSVIRLAACLFPGCIPVSFHDDQWKQKEQSTLYLRRLNHLNFCLKNNETPEEHLESLNSYPGMWLYQVIRNVKCRGIFSVRKTPVHTVLLATEQLQRNLRTWTGFEPMTLKHATPARATLLLFLFFSCIIEDSRKLIRRQEL